jgi:hypothetical protein
MERSGDAVLVKYQTNHKAGYPFKGVSGDYVAVGWMKGMVWFHYSICHTTDSLDYIAVNPFVQWMDQLIKNGTFTEAYVHDLSVSYCKSHSLQHRGGTGNGNAFFPLVSYHIHY